MRPSDVTDRRVPRAMLDIPREAFAGTRKAVAYADRHLPLGTGPHPARALLAPRLLAKLIQALEIGDDAVVLDIGCGTGYSTAILARMARSVVAIEADSSLAAEAQSILSGLAITNAKVVQGPHEAGAVSAGPFDAILINGRVDDVPRALLDQLKDQGRLVAVASEGGVSRAVVWRRFAMQYDRRPLFEADAPAMPGFARAPEFVF